jgi:hypothetical protein
MNPTISTGAPFENDGCTLFPDGLFGVSWRTCCDVHDAAFQSGTTVGEFLRANWELFKCVSQYNPVIAAVMFGGVMTGGALFYFVIGRQFKRKPRDEDNKRLP